MTKKCEACGINPAAVPDRNRMGRPIKRICKECHADRLRGDFEAIIARRKQADDGWGRVSTSLMNENHVEGNPS